MAERNGAVRWRHRTNSRVAPRWRYRVAVIESRSTLLEAMPRSGDIPVADHDARSAKSNSDDAEFRFAIPQNGLPFGPEPLDWLGALSLSKRLMAEGLCSV